MGLIFDLAEVDVLSHIISFLLFSLFWASFPVELSSEVSILAFDKFSAAFVLRNSLFSAALFSASTFTSWAFVCVCCLSAALHAPFFTSSLFRSSDVELSPSSSCSFGVR